MSMRESILQELKQVEEQKGVRILHAVESGSRSWGFSSPDSDYDVRFVYVRPMEDYLRVNEIRDMIEWKLDEVLDINGWDLKKFMRLCANGNATPFEWMNSPDVYYTTPEWHEIAGVCKGYFSEKSAVNHYLGLATNTWHKFLTGETVRYKKYFYALRPLLCARYIERYHQAPPMLFSDLLKMDLPDDVRRAIGELLEKKKVTGESTESPHILPVRDYIRDELDRQKEISRAIPADSGKGMEEINRCFAGAVGFRFS